MKRLKVVMFFATTMFVLNLNAQSMDNKKLGSIIYTLSDTIDGGEGQWQFVINEVPMLCITDEVHNRMRIISPIMQSDDLSKEELMKCMEANFHSALDVKYSVSESILWSTFIHPLKELSKSQVIDAINQVYSAVKTYGSTYSSSNLLFPGGENPKIKRN